MILKEQLVKCTPEIWPQCFQIFNEGSSEFPELCPKNIFIYDSDSLFHAFAENKHIIKKIMFLNGEFFKTICNRNSAILLQFIHNIMIIVLVPQTCATYPIHSICGRILNITTDGKQPYVKTKVNGYGRNFYMTQVHQEHV